MIAPLGNSGGKRTVFVSNPTPMGLFDGRQSWRVVAAFNLIFDYGSDVPATKQNYYAEIRVVRAPVQNHPDRLAIANVRMIVQ